MNEQHQRKPGKPGREEEESAKFNGDDWNERGWVRTRKKGRKQEKENLPSLTLRLEKSEDIVLPDGSLYVPDDRTGRVVHELDANLSDTSAGTSATENLDNLGELDRDFVRSRLLLKPNHSNLVSTL